MGDLFGGGGGEPQITQIPGGTIPDLPLQAPLASAGQWRLHAASPWYSSPWRSIDFLQGLPMAQNMIPQFQPNAMPQYPVGGLGFMSNFLQAPVGPQNLGWLAPFAQMMIPSPATGGVASMPGQGNGSGSGNLPSHNPTPPRDPNYGNQGNGLDRPDYWNTDRGSA